MSCMYTCAMAAVALLLRRERAYRVRRRVSRLLAALVVG